MGIKGKHPSAQPEPQHQHMASPMPRQGDWSDYLTDEAAVKLLYLPAAQSRHAADPLISL